MHDMGNNVTKTPIETLKIDSTQDDFDDNDIHNNFGANNKINGFTEDDLNSDNQFTQQSEDQNWNFSFRMSLDPTEQPMEETNLSINERVREMQRINFDPEINDTSVETNDPELIEEMVIERKAKPMINKLEKTQSMPQFQKRNLEVLSDVNEIDDLESIPSGSKLTLNDNKSDSEDVIQELSRLDLDLEEQSDKYQNYRKRGLSWSNWDNNTHVDLKTESSLSSFSRPASIDHKPIKNKSYTAPEMRGQSDSAIEWMAKEQGLEIGSGLEYENKQKANDINSRNTLRLSSVEIPIPGSVSSATHPTPAVTESEDYHKYDQLDQQIIDSIENEYIR